jgi:uncharacterized protein with WD repeat
MSDINSIPSPILCKLSNTTCKTFTPCRTIGLKRKSSSTPSYKNELKKTKLLNETRKCIQFDEDVKSIKTKTKDKSNSITSYKRDMKHISVLEKQRKIENLKSEIKNSEQVWNILLMINSYLQYIIYFDLNAIITSKYS